MNSLRLYEELGARGLIVGSSGNVSERTDQGMIITPSGGSPDGVDDGGMASITLDGALLQRPGNVDIQLDLFLDYANNVKLYPAFQQYFRTSKPPLMAIWGEHDLYFIPAGAKAFTRDLPEATVQFLDTGHFALETNVEDVALAMREFLASQKI